jgi:hypothetical protein
LGPVRPGQGSRWIRSFVHMVSRSCQGQFWAHKKETSSES